MSFNCCEASVKNVIAIRKISRNAFAGLRTFQLAICSWEYAGGHCIIRVPHKTFAWQLDNNIICSAELCLCAMAYNVLSMLCFPGATKGTIAIRLIGCAASCAISREDGRKCNVWRWLHHRGNSSCA